MVKILHFLINSDVVAFSLCTCSEICRRRYVTTDLSCLVSPVLKDWVFLKKEKKEKNSKPYQFEAIV